VVAVGADRAGIEGLARADRAGIPTVVARVEDFEHRDDWDAALTDMVAGHEPTLVVSAGFMKILGKRFLERFTTVNTHPALLPSFPGARAVRDALAYGVAVTGATVHIVDAGVDTGPVIAQVAVPVLPGDDEAALHERIKSAERSMLVHAVGRMAREGWNVTDRKVTIG
jgi:phosphoribosylglycinamide formyltransferase-1